MTLMEHPLSSLYACDVLVRGVPFWKHLTR